MEENKFWNFADLNEFAQETKEEEILGKLVKIKRVSTAAVSGSDIDPLSIIIDGLVEPKLTLAQLKQAPAAFTNPLIRAITAFSYLDGAEAEKN